MSTRFGGAAPLVWAVLLGCAGLASGCGQPAEPPTGAATTAPELTELRRELEQLENAVGRLEFRVYELESAAGRADPAPTEPRPLADEEIDLTPVN